MKVHMMSMIIILSTFCQLAAVTLVQEDFTSPTFPPPGWSIESQGVAYWYWGDGDPFYAYGYYIHAPGTPVTSGQTSLISNPFSLTANHAITIDFNRMCIEYDCSGAWFKVSLRRDTTITWEFLLLQAWNWEFTEVETPIQTVSSSNYKVVWSLYGYAWSTEIGNIVEFDLDDVLVFYDDTDVTPQSLGRIKADFK